jgi:hypothetical protein
MNRRLTPTSGLERTQARAACLHFIALGPAPLRASLVQAAEVAVTWATCSKGYSSPVCSLHSFG